MIPKYEGQFNGIFYNSYLVSKDGVEIALYPENYHTFQDIKEAKRRARLERDIVRFRVVNNY